MFWWQREKLLIFVFQMRKGPLLGFLQEFWPISCIFLHTLESWQESYLKSQENKYFAKQSLILFPITLLMFPLPATLSFSEILLRGQKYILKIRI